MRLRTRTNILQDRMVWQAASLLLGYPDTEHRARLGAAAELLENLTGPAREPLARNLCALSELDEPPRKAGADCTQLQNWSAPTLERRRVTVICELKVTPPGKLWFSVGELRWISRPSPAMLPQFTPVGGSAQRPRLRRQAWSVPRRDRPRERRQSATRACKVTGCGSVW